LITLHFYTQLSHKDKPLIQMLFVKAAKVLALALVFMPLTGCAIATGLIFASLLKSMSYAPDYEETLFNYAALGFAFVESFSFLLFFVAIAIFAM
jgi:F0F1-type ATP synthase membrane subunit c/vacuolar-type H+-ATPase subunit K